MAMNGNGEIGAQLIGTPEHRLKATLLALHVGKYLRCLFTENLRKRDIDHLGA